jgi:nucleotide-binding universal stress UspA family protein
MIVSKLRQILAAVDFSEPARAAFDRALALSRAHGAELTVVHAIPLDFPVEWHERERRDLIESLRAEANAAGVRFKVSVQSGDPAGVILLHANARRPDLIVLGTSERSGLDRFRYGSVAETVAVQATQPVLVVPPAPRRAMASMPSLKSILVAVDFAEGSREAVQRALAMASAGTRVTVVHVVPGVRLDGSRYLYRGMRPDQKQQARNAWRRIAELVPAGTARKVHARVAIGDPSSVISRVAGEVDADLIVVGVTGRGFLGRLLFGSTAARVIRTAGVPVLTLPAVVEAPITSLADEDQFAVAA